MKTYRIAVIGMAHVHIGTMADSFAALPDTEIVGIADFPPYTEEEHALRLKLNVPKNLTVYEDYRELLAQNIDIAIITTANKEHAAAAEEVLGMGIHAVVEKPMAVSMEDAKRMYRASKKSRGELIINWPIAWFPAFRKAKELADSGAVGKVLRVQYRSPATRGPYLPNEHTPEELSKLWWYQKERGGGSICDYAGYGCVLTTWFTGKVAKRVSGIKKNFFLPFTEAEDYSTFIIDFGESVGLIEGSWSTMSNGEIPTGPIVYGTEGVIVADRFSSKVKVYKQFIPYQPTPAPDAVYEETVLEDSLAQNVMRHLTEGAPLFEMITADFNMKAMAALDAGTRSCESGQTEQASEPFQF